MKVKGTLTIDVWYDETDLEEVKVELSDVMSEILKSDLLCAAPTSAVNGPYIEHYTYNIVVEKIV